MRVGILGAGQLGQMLGFAGSKLGIACRFVDPSSTPPAAQCGDVIQSAFDDRAALVALAQSCDVLTYEFENVPVDALHHVDGLVPVYPPAAALRHAQDRLHEKKLFEKLGIPLPGYRKIDTQADLTSAATSLGLPIVVKTRRMGYDGKGQMVVSNHAELDVAWKTLGGQSLIAEQWVAFDFEVSCLGVRSVSGEIAIYPLARNVHVGGILQTSISPIEDSELSSTAAQYVIQLLEELDYVGVVALECFVKDGALLANEFAPRVHNSGHWTIEGAETSQFENHLRAILDMPLGATANRGHSGMINLIGAISNRTRALDIGTLHDYGKTARVGRKLGHITVVDGNAQMRDANVRRISESVT